MSIEHKIMERFKFFKCTENVYRKKAIAEIDKIRGFYVIYNTT